MTDWWPDDVWDVDPEDQAVRRARDRRRRIVALVVVIAMIAALTIPLLIRVTRDPEPTTPTSVVQVLATRGLPDAVALSVG